MENIQVKKTDFNDILNTIEILIDDVEKVFSQDEIVEQRIQDIEQESKKKQKISDMMKS